MSLNAFLCKQVNQNTVILNKKQETVLISLQHVKYGRFNIIQYQVSMYTENIFIEVERWTQYVHPMQELESLKAKGNFQLIKNYFLHKPLNGYMLKQISSRQLQKIQEKIQNPKFKQIYKNKKRKIDSNRKCEDEETLTFGRSSSKTNNFQSQEEQVSQYLNFQQQEEPQNFKVE